MPLHRDIHWIGRQWAVTGHGMQLIDQKLQGFFDVEVSRLWDDVLIETLHAKDWLNTADFDKGLAIARARYPQPAGAQQPAGALTRPREVAPPPAIEPVVPLPLAAKPEAPKLERPDPVVPPQAIAKLQTPAVAAAAPSEPPSVPPTLFQMRYEGRARFVRPWRVVARKI
jgi:hypothetical protein